MTRREPEPVHPPENGSAANAPRANASGRTPPRELKRRLRRECRAALRSLEPAYRATATEALCQHLLRQTVWRHGNAFLLYAPLPDEPDIWPLTRQLGERRVLCLPRYRTAVDSYEICRIFDPDRDLQTGRFGVREPKAHCPLFPLNRLDLCLLPGVGFSMNGGRLGRGKGYYDRLLASVSVPVCGVAFDEQVIDFLPLEPHDLRLSYLLTPSQWIAFDPCSVMK